MQTSADPRVQHVHIGSQLVTMLLQTDAHCLTIFDVLKPWLRCWQANVYLVIWPWLGWGALSAECWRCFWLFPS